MECSGVICGVGAWSCQKQYIAICIFNCRLCFLNMFHCPVKLARNTSRGRTLVALVALVGVRALVALVDVRALVALVGVGALVVLAGLVALVGARALVAVVGVAALWFAVFALFAVFAVFAVFASGGIGGLLIPACW